ncbi:MAG: cupin-like domain-containing protein [Oscillatoriophycideae cyanobacterium NC_groundwater_1537_Pr4_S-0.65um_50_18]|nr:cupin-like domain-containing protein [Oscillatoriophycideae cyanobacterium NC_groundwater_1537_Pr4_S-0.65um_50_18]
MQTQLEGQKRLSFKNSDWQVPCRTAASLTPKDFFEQYQKPGIPIVITGLLKVEAAWNLDYLCEKLGTLEFPIRHYGQQRYQQDKRQWATIGSGVAMQNMTFAHYAELLRNGTAQAQDLYLGRCTLSHTPLANTPAIAQAEAALGLKFPATNLKLWVGGGGHTTCLHYDPVDGTLMQLQGAKRVLLFPPSQLYNLYPFPITVHLQHGLRKRAVYSQVYPDKPDLEAFPKFEQALDHCHEVILQQGEILFIPSGWWHEVSTVSSADEIVCSVNRFWHVLPIVRSLRSWSKWRAHMGSLLAAPHIVGDVMNAIGSSEQKQKIGQLLQRI